MFIRSATGEAWQEIMLACRNDNETVRCDPAAENSDQTASCGSDFAFVYFISFYILCSFLVSLGLGIKIIFFTVVINIILLVKYKFIPQ